MTRRLKHPIRSAAAGLAMLAAGAVGARAQDVRASATYSATLGGTSVATATIRLSDTGGSYAMEVDARISGLATLVASGTAKLTSAGTSNGRGLVSQKFDLTTRADGEVFNVKVDYADEDVTAFIVTPPIINNIDRIAIERRHLTGVSDMLAPFVFKGGELGAGLCNRRLHIFTGVERFNVALQFARTEEATSRRTGYQGPTVLCSASYTPISGHYTTSEITNSLRESGRILVWFAPLETPGYFIPYRALLSTAVGDVSVVLTKLDQ